MAAKFKMADKIFNIMIQFSIWWKNFDFLDGTQLTLDCRPIQLSISIGFRFSNFSGSVKLNDRILIKKFLWTLCKQTLSYIEKEKNHLNKHSTFSQQHSHSYVYYKKKIFQKKNIFVVVGCLLYADLECT